MSLLEMQRALSRLLTDEELREIYFAEADAALVSYDLSPGERARLRDLQKKRVAIHSHLAMHGRMVLALRAFPLTARVIQANLEEITPAYCKRHPPEPVDGCALETEARRLFAFLLEEQTGKGRWPGYLEALLRHEECLFRLSTSRAAWASCERAFTVNGAASMTLTLARAESLVPVRGAHAELHTFGCDVAALGQALEMGTLPRSAPAETTRMLLFRQRATAAVHAMGLEELPYRMIEQCDGQRSVAGVIGRMADELSLSDDERMALTHGALDVFRTLWDAGALAFEARVAVDG